MPRFPLLPLFALTISLTACQDSDRTGPTIVVSPPAEETGRAVPASSLAKSRTGDFTTGRIQVRFHLTLHNRLRNSDLVLSTFPAPPSPQVVAFPFATQPAGLIDQGASQHRLDGAPHNFFNYGFRIGCRHLRQSVLL